MRRIAQIGLGVVMIGVLFAWLLLRQQPPFDEWATGSTLVRWALHGGAWLSLLGGVRLIAAAWTQPDQPDSSLRGRRVSKSDSG